ncbi:MAG TPA: hypothetical protein VFO38_04345 [Candidatus Saccharimonadales bacterium]|nr:hypothetical protein [Candidatus Saccharimonadales bacterium]
MKKHNQNQKSATGIGLVGATAYLLTLIALGYVTLPFVVVDPHFAEPYGIIFRLGAVTTFILAFVATLTALRGQASKILIGTLRFLVGIAALSILALLFGVLQDALGANCHGFDRPQACTKNWMFAVQFGLSYVLFVPLTLVLNIGFIVGLKQSLRTKSS